MTKSWRVGKFGDVLETVSRPVPVESEKIYRNLGVQWYAKGLFVREEKPGYDIKAQELYRVELGDLVYNRLFAWKGSFAVVEEDTAGGFVSGEFPCFRVDTERADLNFLHLYLSQEKIWQEIARISTGQTNISRLRLKEPVFLGMEIPIPPLSEQRRIVAYIRSLEMQVYQAQRLREEAEIDAEAFWKSSLSSMFVPDPGIQNTVEYSCEEIIDNLHSTPRYDGDEFLCVRSQDIGWGSINYSTMFKTSKEEFYERIRRGEPQKGDIVFVREGDIGRCAVLDGSHRLSLGQRVMMLRPDTKKIISNYMMYQLMSKHVLDTQLLEGKKGTTSHHLNISHFRKVKINVPPLDEQKRIVTYLDELQIKVNALQVLQSSTSSELYALTPSILDKAFKGEL